MDSATLQAIQGMENASVSQDALGNTTIIYEEGRYCCQSRDICIISGDVCHQGQMLTSFSLCSLAQTSDLSAQNALDLLLNMSNARELVGNALQVGAVAHQKITLYIRECIYMEKCTDCVPQVAVLKSEGKVLENGQAQKVVTFHVSENGETVLQEAYEAANSETGELTQIAIEDYEGGGEFSVVEQTAEENHSPENR